MSLGILLAVALPLAAQQSAAAHPKAPAGLSWADADSLEHKLAGVASGARPGALAIGEGELNSYLNLTLAPRLPPGVSKIAVHFAQDALRVQAMIDVDRVRGQVPGTSSWNPLALVEGVVPVEARGRLVNQDGFGSLEVESVHVGSIPIPMTLLEQIVTSATRTRRDPQGFDIHAPFRYPYAVRRVLLRPGRAVLEF